MLVEDKGLFSPNDALIERNILRACIFLLWNVAPSMRCPMASHRLAQVPTETVALVFPVIKRIETKGGQS